MCAFQLKAEKISKSYKRGSFFRRPSMILDSITLGIQRGKTSGIVGESGAGKTTLGRIIAGLEKPSSGKILFRGQDIHRMGRGEFSFFRKKVQMMFQDPEGSLNPKKTISTSLDEVLSLVGLSRRERRLKILEILRTVGLSSDILYRYPSQLSGGQNQRAVLARILLREPEMVILDEPTSALDISVQAQILHLLRHLQEERDLGYLFISHNQEIVKFMCHEIHFLRDGRLVELSV